MAPRPRRGRVPRRIAGAAYPGGNELRQTGDPDDQQRDLLRLVRPRCARSTPRTSTAPTRPPRSCSARTSPRPASFIAEDRPRALDLLGFSSQLIFNTFHNRRLRDSSTPRRRARLRRGARPQPRHARVLLGRRPAAPHLLRPARRPGARHRRDPRRDRPGRRRAPGRLGLPAGLLAEPPRPRSVWAQAQEAGIPVVFHVGGTGDLIDPTTSSTGCPSPRLPRRRRELPLRRLHGHPGARRPRRSPR